MHGSSGALVCYSAPTAFPAQNSALPQDCAQARARPRSFDYHDPCPQYLQKSSRSMAYTNRAWITCPSFTRVSVRPLLRRVLPGMDKAGIDIDDERLDCITCKVSANAIDEVSTTGCDKIIPIGTNGQNKICELLLAPSSLEFRSLHSIIRNQRKKYARSTKTKL